MPPATQIGSHQRVLLNVFLSYHNRKDLETQNHEKLARVYKFRANLTVFNGDYLQIKQKFCRKMCKKPARQAALALSLVVLRLLPYNTNIR
jgi:hypothetical protein